MKRRSIRIEPTGHPDQPYIFVVRFPGKGWKTRRCLSWNEALFAAGLIPPEVQ